MPNTQLAVKNIKEYSMNMLLFTSGPSNGCFRVNLQLMIESPSITMRLTPVSAMFQFLKICSTVGLGMMAGQGGSVQRAVPMIKLLLLSLREWQPPKKLLQAGIQSVPINIIIKLIISQRTIFSRIVQYYYLVCKEGLNYYQNCNISVKAQNMNMRTFQKLSEHILDHNQDSKDDKENQPKNILTSSSHEPKDKPTISKQQVISMKRNNIKKMQELNCEKQKEIDALKEMHEREKQSLIEKYQKIVTEKEEYIKVLQELYSKDESSEQAPVKTTIKLPSTTTTSQQPSYRSCHGDKFNQTLYMHQVPLYNELCYSIQRPSQSRALHKTSQFFCTQRLKSRITSSNSKSREKINMSLKQAETQESKHRAKSSKHGLAPACPPQYYCKLR